MTTRVSGERMTPGERLCLMNALKVGHSNEYLMERFNLSLQTVQAYRKRHMGGDIPAPRPPKDPEKVKLAPVYYFKHVCRVSGCYEEVAPPDRMCSRHATPTYSQENLRRMMAGR